MILEAPSQPMASADPWWPPDLSPKNWQTVPYAERAVLWLEYREGVRFELEGPNRGPWMRFFLRGDEGQAWCAAVLLRAIESTGGPRPLGDPRFGRWGWYYPNRSVQRWEANAKKGGTWKGPACSPSRGDLVFYRARNGSDRGRGRHVDICTAYDAGERVISVIGGNVSNGIKRRKFRLGDPRITGFGEITPHLVALRGAA